MEFAAFMREEVRARITDEDYSFEQDLRGLGTTGMTGEFVRRFLTAVPETQSWDIGEALAECLLEQDTERNVDWPWNTVRDKRTPRASLPGADLVGFCSQGDTVLLLFGEVKTSSDAGSPPNVMHGGSGMTWQLERSANQLDIQRSLLQWLSARCRTGKYRDLYERAVSRYLASHGKEILIIGVLIRDTEPNEADIKNSGKSLGKNLNAPTQVELTAWYLPVPIADWLGLLQEEAS